MQRKFGVVIVFLATLLILTVGLTTNVHAAIVQTGISSPSFSALEKTCAEIDAYLHGTQPPTITCARAKAVSAVSPHTQAASCNVDTPSMIIVYVINSQNDGSICFIGTGYLGYRVNAVVQVFSPNQGNGKGLDGWFRWYLHGSTQGNYYNLNQGNGWVADFAGTDVDITQVNPGGQHA